MNEWMNAWVNECLVLDVTVAILDVMVKKRNFISVYCHQTWLPRLLPSVSQRSCCNPRIMCVFALLTSGQICICHACKVEKYIRFFKLKNPITSFTDCSSKKRKTLTYSLSTQCIMTSELAHMQSKMFSTKKSKNFQFWIARSQKHFPFFKFFIIKTYLDIKFDMEAMRPSLILSDQSCSLLKITRRLKILTTRPWFW